jgi:prephenate dehydrogenase
VSSSHEITVRVSDAGLAALATGAGRAGLSLAAYISRAGMDVAGYRAEREKAGRDRDVPPIVCANRACVLVRVPVPNPG